jgi:hypothetical protein
MTSLAYFPLLLFAAVALIAVAVPVAVERAERRRAERAVALRQARRARLVLIEGGKPAAPPDSTQDRPASRIA